ncbi:hypothetical protein TrCOL_g10436 [Triparma columacea]|uniref:Uncharacterized protein n=1 Tax=Triparma columacea TaxID=722753 RepID=A0A9W7GBN4_9STRA|nr:hypothetical protein TrCOL_g10436 [Triparma columacea]
MLALKPTSDKPPQAVLGAFKALQERIRTITHEKSEAQSRAAQLRSELSSREADSVVKREDFARDEMERLESGRSDLEKLTEAKHLAEIALARNEEQRKAAVAATQNEMNRTEDHRQETAASEGKISLLKQRNSHLERELEQGKENVERLKNLTEKERDEGDSRIRDLTRQLEQLESAVLNEDNLSKNIDAKCLRQEDFLKSVMSINEALVQSAYQNRESGLMERQRGGPSHMSSSCSSGVGSRSRTGTKKKKVKRKGKRKTSTFKRAVETPPPPPPPQMRSTRRHQSRPALGRRNNKSTSASAAPLRRRGEGYAQEGPSIRTTKSSRLAAVAAKARAEEVALKKRGKQLNIKDRIRSANFGPVPFLPAPHTHSFNVLAAVSEAVRCEVGDLEYKVTTRKGSVSLVPSPPRVGQTILKRCGDGPQTLQVSVPSVPGINLGGAVDLDAGLKRRQKIIGGRVEEVEEVGGGKEMLTTQQQQQEKEEEEQQQQQHHHQQEHDRQLQQQQQQQQQQPQILSPPTQQNQRIPPELIALMNSLEKDYAACDERYQDLMSRAQTDEGTLKMEGKEDEDNLKFLAAEMERKEQQVNMLRGMLPLEDIASPPLPPRLTSRRHDPNYSL